MIKKIIKYTDFNGNENEEVVYFNLNKVECTKLQVSKAGGLKEYIEEVVKSGDEKAMIELFDTVLLTSYGIKSDDGKRFIKSEQLKQEFMQSPAYEAIFMQIATNVAEADAFMKGVIS